MIGVWALSFTFFLYENKYSYMHTFLELIIEKNQILYMMVHLMWTWQFDHLFKLFVYILICRLIWFFFCRKYRFFFTYAQHNLMNQPIKGPFLRGSVIQTFLDGCNYFNLLQQYTEKPRPSLNPTYS